MFDIFGNIFDIIFIHPMINALAFFYDILGNNIGWAIIFVTIIINLLLTPFTLRQNKQMKKMQALQPQLKQLQKKYSAKDSATRKKLSEETFKLYKQAGLNPIGCLGPLVIQIPIWLAFYRAVLLVIPFTPEGFVRISNALYSSNPALSEVPFSPYFLGIDMVQNVMSAPTPWQFLLPFFVGASLFFRQSLSSTPSADPQQARQARLFLWMLPIMFGVFTLFFPAGLGLYIFVGNLVGIGTYLALGNRPNIPKIVIGGRTLYGGTKGSSGGSGSGGGSDTDTETTTDGKDYKYDGEKELELQRENRRRGNRAGAKRPRNKSRGR